MKNLLALILCLPLFASGQNLKEQAYDFWLGKWQAEWTNADGSKGSGTNHIFKVLDGRVLEENFLITTGGQAGFKGKSLSVFNSKTKAWHQAWADNQGGYYDFYGSVEDDKKMFSTHPTEKDGKIIQQRMIFYNISHEKFTWDWEGTTNGGKTWDLLWRIYYSRLE
jgi:hypothetical protein